MNPANEGAYTVAAKRCHACAEQASAMSSWGDGASSDRGGLYFNVRRE
jgi:hypothetical protein